MTPDSGPVRQEAADASPDITDVGAGILRLQLPIHLPGLGHVNCYVLEDGNGFAVVDPGLPGPAGWAALEVRLDAAGVPPDRIHTIVCTHSHADHFGGAVRLQSMTSGADIVTHQDFMVRFDPFEDLAPDPVAITDEELERHLVEKRDRTPWGGDPPVPSSDMLAMFRSLPPEVRESMRPPTPSRRVIDADHIELGRTTWVALHTPGHTADHLCLYAPEHRLLLSGDHVLPTITPHIGGLGLRADPLQDFFNSLDRLLELEIERILPAHGHPFVDLDDRIASIHQHHLDRLAKIEEIAGATGPMGVVAFSHELFRERSWGPLAESETYAHLEHLRLLGRVRSERVDGELRYLAVEADQATEA